jgi:hypothetical protein
MTVTLYVPDVPEFSPLLRAAEKVRSCTVLPVRDGYWRVRTEAELHFSRKEMGLTPALWNSALSGGFCGRIVEYGRDVMRIASEAE